MRSKHDKRSKPFGRPSPERRTGGEQRHERPERQSNSVIYGVSPVLEALRAENRRIDKVLIAENSREHRLNEIIDLCRERSIAWNRVPRDSFMKYVGPEANVQGVAALLSSAEYTDVDVLVENAADPALFLVLDGVEDPRNLGAILRSAECAGCDGIVIPERRAVGLTDTVAKSSAGAIEHIKVAKVPNLNRFIERLKADNIWVVGTSGDAEMEYTDWDWSRPSAIVLGNEGEGLHRLVAENCDVLVKIPMHGKIGSLNVSVAAGVLLFEAQRQRRSGK